MKRGQTLIFALVILLVLIVGIVVVKKVEKHVDEIQTVDEVIIALNEDSVSRFSWDYNDETLSFEKNDEGLWVSPDDTTFPVDQEKIEDFLADFESVHASFIIDDINDYGQYGLDNPEASISFTLENGVFKVDLGDFSVMDSKRYVSVGDGKVYLIDTDLLEHVSVNRDSFIKNDKLEKMSQVTDFKVSGEINTEIVYDEENYYTYTNNFDYYLLVDGMHKFIAEDAATKYIQAVTDLSLYTYATYNASTSDLSQYGLDKPAFTATVTGLKKTDDDQTEEVSYTVYVGYVEDKSVEVAEGEEPEKLVYARVGDSEIIYSVYSSTYDTLIAGDYASLRNKNVLSLSRDSILSVSANVENHDLNVEHFIENADKDDEKDYFMADGYEVSIDEVLSALNGLEVTDSYAKKESDTLEFEVNIKVDVENYSDINLKIYRYDGDSCFVELNNEAVGLISRANMVSLKEAFTSLYFNLGKEE